MRKIWSFCIRHKAAPGTQMPTERCALGNPAGVRGVPNPVARPRPDVGRGRKRLFAFADCSFGAGKGCCAACRDKCLGCHETRKTSHMADGLSLAQEAVSLVAEYLVRERARPANDRLTTCQVSMYRSKQVWSLCSGHFCFVCEGRSAAYWSG